MHGILTLLAAAALGLAAAPPADAQSYPAKAVTMVVPTPAGGPLDFVARLVAEKMGAKLGQPFIIENRPGAFGNIGAQAVAKAAPDGTTLLWVVDVTMTSNRSVYGKLPFDPERDFAPVALVTESGSALVLNPSVPARSVAELVALAKKQPLAYASGGNGSPGHLLGEQFKIATGAPMTHVPYKGNAPAVASMLAGQTQVFFSSIPGILRHVKAGKLKALAVTLPSRSAYLPELPTMAEAGVPGMDTSTWFGLFAPAGTPQAVVDLLYREVAAAVQQPDVHEKLSRQGLDPVVAPPAVVAERMRKESAKWAEVVRKAGITVD